MTYKFRSNGLIVVAAEVEGPGGVGVLQMALDTGATRTLINSSLLVTLGYDLAAAPSRVEMTTGSGVEFVPLISVDRITALGLDRRNAKILGHTLPPSAGIDGLLGLDFFGAQRLTIDFAACTVTVA